MKLRRWGLVLMTVLAALAWTGNALADDPLVDQYTEQVPTASGPKGTGSGGGGTGGTSYTAPLPSSVKTKVESRGGKDTKLLEAVATSSRYGAPTIRPGLETGDLTASSPGALSAAANAVTDGSDARLIGLFIALLATAAVMLGAAAGRRGRRHSF
jgi:hypothetical protein